MLLYSDVDSFISDGQISSAVAYEHVTAWEFTRGKFTPGIHAANIKSRDTRGVRFHVGRMKDE